MRFKAFVLTFLVLFSFSLSRSQDEEIIKVSTSLVRLNVGVVDRNGKPVLNLKKEDFMIYEDGIKQAILNFEPNSSPFSVVLLLDMSGSTLAFRQTLKLAAARFIDALAPEDRVAVIEFYEKINLRNDFTTDRKIILNSINVANGRGKTQLYKALDFALDKLKKEKNRRKVIVVLTDGVDTDLRNQDREALSKIEQDKFEDFINPEDSSIFKKVIEEAEKEGISIYPLALPTGDPKLLPDPTPLQVALFKIARERLEILARRTGASLNNINRLEEMGRVYATVAAEIRTLYTIEYLSSNDKRDGKWRTISIQMSDPELIARTKPGYYAK
jgi:VWFA-related protein